MNKVFLIGNLTADPVVRSTSAGTSVCQFTIAVDRRVKKEGRENVDFVPIVTWSGLADVCGRFLKKGNSVAVLGEMQNRKYKTKEGSDRWITEVMADEVKFLTKKEAHEQSGFTDLPDDEPLPWE